MEERGLIEQGVAVDVVTRHLEGDHVYAGLEFGGEVPLIHTKEAVRAASRTMSQEMAVEEDAIKGGARGAQQDFFLDGGLEGGAETDEEILLCLAAFRPNRLGRDEGWGRGREVRTHQKQQENGA